MDDLNVTLEEAKTMIWSLCQQLEDQRKEILRKDALYFEMRLSLEDLLNTAETLYHHMKQHTSLQELEKYQRSIGNAQVVWGRSAE